MRLLVLLVGKTRNPACRQELEHYRQRLGRYLTCEVRELKEEKPGRKESPKDFCRRQAPGLCAEFAREPGPRLLLDEHGRQRDSREFAAFLERLLGGGHRNLVFLCGGAFGYDDRVRQSADHLVSLSRLTFPHELARVLLFEQLYRALTIIRHEPYHY
jgi:23S rRNA (pseudouridine1915-N3)-methyltransferase